MKIKFAFITIIFVLFSSNIFAKNTPKENVGDLRARTKSLEEQVKILQSQIDVAHPGMSKSIAKIQKSDGYDKDNKNKFDTLIEMYAHGPAVVTSPAFGIRRAAGDEFEDESPLMTELPKINEDLVLLHIRRKMDKYAVKNNIEIPTRPIIALSGALDGNINYKQEYNKLNKLDVNLDGAQVDIIGETGPWVTSAISITYDDERVSGGTRVSNSKLKLDRGFITVGQLNKSPMYFSIGQMFVPFGRFSSNMLTKTSTRLLGRTKDRAVILGYSKDAFNVQIYGFPGETKGTNNGTVKSFLGHSGFHIGNNYKIGKVKIDLEGSAIGNIAESDGMQKNVFALNATSESIHSRVWGINGNIRVKYDPFTVSSEYIGAARRFDSRDLAFNNQGARPQAINVEGAVEFKTMGRPSLFAIGYGQTWQALSLALPKQNYFAQYDVDIFKSVYFAVEYRHDVNYALSDTATSMPAGSITGRHKNTVTGKIFVYF
ncbi:MAG: hypothetical protein ACD_69C00136G0001 [uncultured bacterium]|nr:MAG: hypothetical protein ACD_69C00136G0001 [uncultured bacterium]OGT09152.1 MAG: hypothetical protein A2V89_00685 [Gammaproteobacteria bacterium RBG_16_37_9]HBC71844.1 hypothetical protein [Coxiellaceae bacterium]